MPIFPLNDESSSTKILIFIYIRQGDPESIRGFMKSDDLFSGFITMEL